MSPMKVRIRMCPASMFAKRRTLSEMRRMNWPRISSGTIRIEQRLRRLRDPALEVTHGPVPADALDVGEDEGHEREGERHGQRRGGGVDAPDREAVPRLAGERQRDEAEEVDDEDEEQQARHVGEPAADRLRRQALLGDLRLRDLVDLLADRLACARLDADARAHEEDPERHRDDRADHQVHDRLVDRHVERRRGGSGPRDRARTRASGRTRRGRRPGSEP